MATQIKYCIIRKLRKFRNLNFPRLAISCCSHAESTLLEFLLFLRSLCKAKEASSYIMRFFSSNHKKFSSIVNRQLVVVSLLIQNYECCSWSSTLEVCNKFSYRYLRKYYFCTNINSLVDIRIQSERTHFKFKKNVASHVNKSLFPNYISISLWIKKQQSVNDDSCTETFLEAEIHRPKN